MTWEKILRATKVRKMTRIGEHTISVEFISGDVRPATPLEWRLWQLLVKGEVEDEQT